MPFLTAPLNGNVSGGGLGGSGSVGSGINMGGDGGGEGMGGVSLPVSATAVPGQSMMMGGSIGGGNFYNVPTMGGVGGSTNNLAGYGILGGGGGTTDRRGSGEGYPSGPPSTGPGTRDN